MRGLPFFTGCEPLSQCRFKHTPLIHRNSTPFRKPFTYHNIGYKRNRLCNLLEGVPVLVL